MEADLLRDQDVAIGVCGDVERSRLARMGKAVEILVRRFVSCCPSN
jgi:hypothetical protein